jgi:Tfp pilus assembly protein PilV
MKLSTVGVLSNLVEKIMKTLQAFSLLETLIALFLVVTAGTALLNYQLHTSFLVTQFEKKLEDQWDLWNKADD